MKNSPPKKNIAPKIPITQLGTVFAFHRQQVERAERNPYADGQKRDAEERGFPAVDRRGAARSGDR